jgi:hypothetical protein
LHVSVPFTLVRGGLVTVPSPGPAASLPASGATDRTRAGEPGGTRHDLVTRRPADSAHANGNAKARPHMSSHPPGSRVRCAARDSR